jgi:WD40 repeat protein
MKHGTSILSCLYSADGKRIIAAGGGRIPGCDTSIRVFDCNSGIEALICQGHVCGIYELALEPRTGFLASASEDYSVFLWNLEQRDAIFLVGVGGEPIVKGHVAFASEKSWLAVGEKEAYDDLCNSAFVLDLDSGHEVFRQKLERWKEIAGLAISGDGATLVVAVANHQHNPQGVELYCWDVLRGKSVWKTSTTEIDITELHWLPGEERLAAAIMVDEGPQYCSGACLLDAKSGTVLGKKVMTGIGANVAVSPDGDTLAVAFGEGGIDLLRASDLSLLKKLVEGKGTQGGFCSVQFSPDGKTVLAGAAFHVDGQGTRGVLQTFATTTKA